MFQQQLMKKVCTLLLILGSFVECKKQNSHTIVALELKHNQGGTYVEWDFTEGSFMQQGGKLTINAECSTGEVFKLMLENISDTGHVNNLSLQQIYFSIEGEFNPTQIKNGNTQINNFSSRQINGNFKAGLANDLAKKEIEGKFTMHMSE